MKPIKINGVDYPTAPLMLGDLIDVGDDIDALNAFFSELAKKMPDLAAGGDTPPASEQMLTMKQMTTMMTHLLVVVGASIRRAAAQEKERREAASEPTDDIVGLGVTSEWLREHCSLELLGDLQQFFRESMSVSGLAAKPGERKPVRPGKAPPAKR